jgi:PAS domain S-box-containing protein
MSSDKKSRETAAATQSMEELLHDLHVHQIELEKQNIQLKEAQQELEEARDRYANLYDYAPVGFLTLDDAGVVQDINLTGATMLGKERSSIVGHSFINVLAPYSIQTFANYLQQTFSASGNSVAEVNIRVKGGETRIVNLESVAIPGVKPTCRTVMNDLTEQRLADNALQVNRAAQDALLNAIPAMVFYQDTNLRFLSVSLAFTDFFGCQAEDVVGKSFSDLLPEKAATEIRHISVSVLQTGMALYGFEHSMPDANGHVTYLSTVISPFRDTNNNIIGLVGVCIDISHIKSASVRNSELLAQNRELTRSLFTVQEEERRHLARELHDELGQWLTAIQAEAHVICNITNSHAPKIHDSALAISNSAKAVHGVIRNMLRKLRPSMLDELGLADSLRELHAQWCNSHPDVICEFKLDVRLDGLGEEINVTIYRLVQESLSNIASHAEAHKVVVSFQRETEPESGAELLMLQVEDNGIGFDVKQTPSGIGLLGMRERVIVSGGEFYIDSVPGSGTKITARMPLKK